jgi:hypothetical protein
MTIYEENLVQDLQHTLGQLEAHLEVEKRRAEKAEQALADQQAANEADDEEDSQDQGDDEEQEGEDQPSSQLKRRQALELSNHRRKSMKKQQADYPATAGNGQVSAAAVCSNCGGRGHEADDCPSPSMKGSGGGTGQKRKVGKIVAKAAESSELVKRCLNGVSKGLAGRRDDYDAALEVLANKIAAKCGISKAQAMSAALGTEVGQQLYSGYTAAAAPSTVAYDQDDEREAIAKARPGPPVMVDSSAPGEVLVAIEKGERVSKSSLESALDALASKYQSSTGMSFYKAYSLALDSEPGRAIYKRLVEL